MITNRRILHCLYDAMLSTIKHDGVEHAGYMAFLCLLSIFPFLVFIIALTGFVGESAMGAQFVQFLLSHLPAHIKIALEPRIEEIISGPPQGLLTIAIVGAIWTASSFVEGLRTILNRVYHVKTPPAYVWRRLLSIVQFLALTAIIIITMLLFIIIPILWDKLATVHIIGMHLSNILDLAAPIQQIWPYIRYIIVGITLLSVVSTLYFIIPNIKLRWSYILPGSILVVLLWFLGGTSLSFYLSHVQQVSIIYGSLGGIIISLIFFYILNMIFIYGAEFNYLFSQGFVDNIPATTQE